MSNAKDWWHSRHKDLLAIARTQCPVYVLNEETLNEIFFDLLSIDALDNLIYPLYLNHHPKIVVKALEMGLHFMCTSGGEIDNLLKVSPEIDPKSVLFLAYNTRVRDLEFAFSRGFHIVLSDPNILIEHERIFKGRGFFLSRDVIKGHGLRGLTEASVKGFYIHPKGKFSPLGHPGETVSLLAEASRYFPQVSIVILSNEREESSGSEKAPMNIPGLGNYLEAIKEAWPQFSLWLELPDFLFNRAGALLAGVISKDEEGKIRNIRINVDIKALHCDGLRRECYKIVNLSKIDDRGKTGTIQLSGTGKSPGKEMAFFNAPAIIDKGDILLFANIGMLGPEKDSRFKGPDLVTGHYLSARRICQVRI